MIELEGVVTEALPNTLFKVDIGNGHTIEAHLTGSIDFKESILFQSLPEKVEALKNLCTIIKESPFKEFNNSDFATKYVHISNFKTENISLEEQESLFTEVKEIVDYFIDFIIKNQAFEDYDGILEELEIKLNSILKELKSLQNEDFSTEITNFSYEQSTQLQEACENINNIKAVFIEEFATKFKNATLEIEKLEAKLTKSKVNKENLPLADKDILSGKNIKNLLDETINKSGDFSTNIKQILTHALEDDFLFNLERLKVNYQEYIEVILEKEFKKDSFFLKNVYEEFSSVDPLDPSTWKNQALTWLVPDVLIVSSLAQKYVNGAKESINPTYMFAKIEEELNTYTEQVIKKAYSHAEEQTNRLKELIGKVVLEKDKTWGTHTHTHTHTLYHSILIPLKLYWPVVTVKANLKKRV